MASVRSAWGIDIGNRALKAIKLVRGESGLRIDDFEIIEHEHVLSIAGDNKESLVQSALANFVQRHPVKGQIAAVSVSGVSSFARFIKLPPVAPNKIPEIVKFEAVQQIPFPLDEVEWSYQLFQAPDSPDVEVGIFAMRRELINHHIKHFTDVDMNVQVVQMNPLAVYNAMYYDGRLKGTTMIVDLGAENTDLIIADGETIWLRSIPIGGNNFTEVLVKSFKLPFAKAEELKRNANTSKYARQIFQAMRPVFADLVAEIQRSMGFYSSVHRDSRIKKIIALGGTFRLAGLQKYLQQNLQLDVEKLNELAAGAPADAKMATTFNQNLLSLVSAYGLAIQAMGEGKISSSLLPQHIRREKMWRDKTKWFGAAAATFVAGTGLALGGYYMQDLGYKSQDTVRQYNDETLSKAQALDSQWHTKVEGAGADARLKITNTRSMLDYRTLMPGILADLTAALPPLPRAYATGDVVTIKKIPRANRPVIFLEKIIPAYTDDLLRDIAKPGQGVGVSMGLGWPGVPPGPLAGPDAALPAGSRGYLVTLYITTPNADGYLYVLNSLVANLKKFDRAAMDKYNTINPRNQKNHYIARAFPPTQAMRLGADTAWMSAAAASYAAANAVTSDTIQTTTLGMQPLAAAGDPNATLDRLTKEDRKLDWEMRVPVVIVIDPPKVAPAPQ
ncbi:MAG: type IV pilus assembly protein PilM [Planctomycetota bacterium]|nr:type IV pilus assembly protein PilM [Planctomycetota bacterium]